MFNLSRLYSEVSVPMKRLYLEVSVPKKKLYLEVFIPEKFYLEVQYLKKIIIRAYVFCVKHEEL